MFKVDILIVDQIANKEILPRHVATTFVARGGKI